MNLGVVNLDIINWTCHSHIHTEISNKSWITSRYDIQRRSLCYGHKFGSHQYISHNCIIVMRSLSDMGMVNKASNSNI